MDAPAQELLTADCFARPAQATRKHALERLEDFLPRAGKTYAAMRNNDYGPQNRSNVSTLSPWIRHRLILEEEVIATVLGRHSFSAAQKFVQEVFWRTYFKGWLEQRPQVWIRYRVDVENLLGQLATESPLRQRYVAAIEGNTGIDCFDAWANELVETGYLHNHARMWFASIWIFTLKLPWQLGADFFLRHLLDGDQASNTLGWRWVAGLHTKGKTYLARAANIEKFTNGRFNPVGQLVANALPLAEPDAGPPIKLLPPDRLSADTPFALLVTEEDCSPDNMGLPGKPKAVLGLSAPGSRSPLPQSPLVEQFSSAAIRNGLARCSDRFGLVATQRQSRRWADDLTELAQQANVKTIVTAHVPVGPIADLVASARRTLHQRGIEVAEISRPYDVASWPHATRGFFALKSKIPKILSGLALTT